MTTDTQCSRFYRRGSGLARTRLLLLSLTASTLIACGEARNRPPGVCTVEFRVTNLVELEALSRCTAIDGDLGLGLYEGGNWEDIKNLSALSNLTSVSGRLSIWELDSLRSLRGRSNLTRVGSGTIESNRRLASIDGLSSLTTVDSRLNIVDNEALTIIDGLTSLTAVDGSLTIQDNPSLCQSLVTALLDSLSSRSGYPRHTTPNDDTC